MLMTVSTAGIVHDSKLESGPLELVRHGLWPLALIVAFTTAIAPLGKYAGMLYVLIGARARTPFPYLGRVFRFARTMGIWAMLEVLLLGVFVAFTKLGDLVHIEVGPAVWALGLLTITALWADTAIDPDAVWEAIERSGQTQAPMPEDRSLVFHPGMVGCEVLRPGGGAWRRPARPLPALRRGAASAQARRSQPHLGLYHRGRDPLHPGQRLSGADRDPGRLRRAQHHHGRHRRADRLAHVSAGAPGVRRQRDGAGAQAGRARRHADGGDGGHHRARRQPPAEERTKLYYIVAWIGRWSMVDIFMESLLGALVQFGAVVSIAPGMGAVAFCGVVIITILGAEAFDPRVMWDAAGQNKHRPWQFLRARKASP